MFLEIYTYFSYLNFVLLLSILNTMEYFISFVFGFTEYGHQLFRFFFL